MSSSNAGTLENIAVQVTRFFEPLRLQLQNRQAIELFSELGVAFPPELEESADFAGAMRAARAPLDALPRLVNQLIVAVDSGQFELSIELFDDLREAIQSAGEGLQALADGLDALAAAGELPGFTPAEVADFTSDLPARLIDWTAVTYLEEASLASSSLLDLFGMIDRVEEQVGSTDPRRPQFTRKTLRLAALPMAIFNPFGALRALYGLW